jgi:hypothetical protein
MVYNLGHKLRQTNGERASSKVLDISHEYRYGEGDYSCNSIKRYNDWE